MTITRHLFGLCRFVKPNLGVLKPQRFIHQTPRCFAVRKGILGAIIKPATEESLRKSDKILNGFSLIYKAPADKYILSVSAFVLLTVSGLLTYVFIYFYHGMTFEEIVPRKTFGQKRSVTTNKTELIIAGIGTVVFNIMLTLMIRRYPLRIWKNGENYVAVFEGHIPFVRRQLKFVKGQVEPVPAKGVLPWAQSRFLMNGNKTILVDTHFKTPSELHQMINKKFKYI
ncbi:uncharacterized protein LOC134828207 [Culicoides brevitarsis]|uniref:uncharacterized protein LOC134828207 n=1 Tax=Culicoides brevitarsis TaxID=469753 RepID=UPI00307C9A90